MKRFIWAVIFWLVMVVVGIAVVIYYAFGWKAVLLAPAILILLIVLVKLFFVRTIKWLFLIPFRAKASALRKAQMEVHSITPTTVLRKMADVDEDEDTKEEIQHYYAVDVTIKPRPEKAGRFWEPGEFILTSEPARNLEALEEKSVGHLQEVRIWDGSQFAEDDPGKYAGEQRLKLTFAVKPGTRSGCLQYYDEYVGNFEFPEWRADA